MIMSTASGMMEFEGQNNDFGGTKRYNKVNTLRASPQSLSYLKELAPEIHVTPLKFSMAVKCSGSGTDCHISYMMPLPYWFNKIFKQLNVKDCLSSKELQVT